eukprot:11440094-Alexandrium_andersonii.AAC.1
MAGGRCLLWTRALNSVRAAAAHHKEPSEHTLSANCRQPCGLARGLSAARYACRKCSVRAPGVPGVRPSNQQG